MKSGRGTLYSLVTRYYIFFAAAVLLLVFLVVNVSGYFIERTEMIPDIKNFISNTSLIENEKYDRLNIHKYLSKKSYFEVLDEAANVIYTSDESRKNTYSPEELEFIPEESGNSYYYMEQVADDKGRNVGYLINKYAVINSDEGETISLSGIVILDKDKKVVFSDLGLDMDYISDREFDILYGNGEDTYLQKYEFTNVKGQKRTMLIHQDFSSSSLAGAYRRIYTTAILFFILVFAIFVVIFVLHTAFAVRKPITVLQDAMGELGKGNRDVAITYSGPREFVQIMDSFNDMADKLSRAELENKKLEQERQKILADISHDLRTPITVIQGYSRAVADGIVPEGEQAKYLDTISRKADNLSELINAFYEYSKLEHPEFQLFEKECNICEYFREYLAGKYSELDIAGYEMDIDIPEERIMKTIDTAQLKRVFENIISNSIRSNPAGTRIYAGLKKDNDKVIIYLGDNGVGVPSSIRDEIFKPFVVGDDARTSGKGTGLGMSIAKLIVEAHGGTIRLMDEGEVLKSEDGTVFKTMFEITI